MAKSKKIKDLEQEEMFPAVKTIVLNRDEVRQRPELGGFIKKIWDLRSDWIMSNMRGYPSIIIISRELEHEMYMYFTARPIEDSIAMDFLGHGSCGPNKGRKIFNMRVIASGDVSKDEIIIK
jgi:hypothetical protein